MSGRARDKKERVTGSLLRSLHMRLAMILVVLIIAVMAVVGTFLINWVSTYYFDDFTEQMNSAFTANMYSALKSEAASENGAEALKGALEAYSSSLGISSNRNFYILDGKTGAMLEGSDDSEPERTPAVISALGGKIGQEKRVSAAYFDRAVPIIIDDKVEYIVYIKDTKQDMAALTNSLFQIIIRAILFALVIAIILSLVLSKTITTPIENLTRSAKLMSMGEFKTRLEVHSQDEIGILTETFNDMAQVLHETLEKVEGERDKLNTLFLHMTDGVTAFSRNGEIIHINPAAEEMLGVRLEDKPSFEELYGSTGISFERVLSQKATEFLERDYAVSGRVLKVYFAAFGSGDGGVIAVVHDITEQFKLEQSRREFVANVSHELRTPLTNVKSYTETLMEMGEPEPELSARFYQVILNETDRMTRIVKDLLTLSKLDYAKMDWKISEFPIKKSIENVYDAMVIEAKNHKHEFTLDIEGDLPVISGDQGRIEQVIVNIVGNAIKYTPDGGVVKIKARHEGEFTVIQVSDTGIGIAEKDIPRLFERFYRVDKARSRAKGGTGLGLAIAREIIEHHGGTIKIESTLDVGTTATITLADRPTNEEDR